MVMMMENGNAVRVLSLKAIGGDAEQINPFLAKWGS